MPSLLRCRKKCNLYSLAMASNRHLQESAGVSFIEYLTLQVWAQISGGVRAALHYLNRELFSGFNGSALKPTELFSSLGTELSFVAAMSLRSSRTLRPISMTVLGIFPSFTKDPRCCLIHTLTCFICLIFFSWGTKVAEQENICPVT